MQDMALARACTFGNDVLDGGYLLDAGTCQLDVSRAGATVCIPAALTVTDSGLIACRA